MDRLIQILGGIIILLETIRSFRNYFEHSYRVNSRVELSEKADTEAFQNANIAALSLNYLSGFLSKDWDRRSDYYKDLLLREVGAPVQNERELQVLAGIPLPEYLARFPNTCRKTALQLLLENKERFWDVGWKGEVVLDSLKNQPERLDFARKVLKTPLGKSCSNAELLYILESRTSLTQIGKV